MSKFKYFLIAVFAFGLFIASPKAVTCSYDKRAELNSEASNITANYEVVTIEADYNEHGYQGDPSLLESEEPITIEVLQVNILNLTENFYAEVTNSFDETTTTYNYSDTDNGNISIIWENTLELTTYTIEIYSSDITGCEGNLIRTLRVSLPRFNRYSDYGICNQIPDYYMCQRYVTYAPVDFAEFSNSVLEEVERVEQEEQEESRELSWYESIWKFIVDNKVPIIIGAVSIVVIGGVVAIVIVRKRRRDEIWKKV